MSSHHLCAALLALALVGCQGQGTQSMPDASAPGPETLAAAALQRGQYREAADLYRKALETTPGSVPLHFGFAVALSHLDLKADTIREFRWILENAEPGSSEVETARRWLLSAGALPPSRRPPSADSFKEAEQQPGRASLEGEARFGETSSELKPMRRLQLFLIGQSESPTKDEYYVLRTDEQGRFRFPNIAPGPYKLTNRIAGVPIWRLRVELKPSQVGILDLTPANSIAARDDFPEPS